MLSEKIYSLRRKNGLSQEQLAEKIGVSRQAVSKWEGGLSTPELDKLRALSECFQITMDELTENQTIHGSGDADREEQAPAPGKGGESRLGVLTVMHPSTVDRISGSSAVTLNGTGMLILLFVLLMVSGMRMMFKKK